MDAFDAEKTRDLLTQQLPLRARWLLGSTSWDWDFSRTRQPLQSLTPQDIAAGAVPSAWLQLLLFAEEDIAQGGGASPFVALHRETGAVYGLDVERETSAIYILNSTAQRFVDTFLLFDEVIGRHAASPPGLTARVRAIDPDIFPQSEWRYATDTIETLHECA